MKTTFKDAKIGVLSVVSSPIFKNFLEEENSYNKLIEEYCQKQNFEFIDMREKWKKSIKKKVLSTWIIFIQIAMAINTMLKDYLAMRIKYEISRNIFKRYQ